MLRILQRIRRIIFRRSKSNDADQHTAGLDDDPSDLLDHKCTICKNITAARFIRGEVPGAVLSELNDADMILNISPIKSHIGNPHTQLKLCKKHHRLLFKAMDQLIANR